MRRRDKKRREEVDTRNNADQLVFQIEKALGEFGDKVSASEKSDIETKVSALKEALKSGSIDDIKAKMDEAQKAFYAVSEKVYQQAAQQQGAQGAPGAQQGPAGGETKTDDGASTPTSTKSDNRSFGSPGPPLALPAAAIVGLAPKS